MLPMARLMPPLPPPAAADVRCFICLGQDHYSFECPQAAPIAKVMAAWTRASDAARAAEFAHRARPASSGAPTLEEALAAQRARAVATFFADSGGIPCEVRRLAYAYCKPDENEIH